MRAVKEKLPIEDDLNLHRLIVDEYKRLESKLDVRYKSASVSYVSPVNFTESMATPRHRWFPYKEGFSPSFVNTFLSEHVVNKKGAVVDPFCGVGTTNIVAAQNGFSSYGLDVSPLAIFVAKTKSLGLDKSQVRTLKQHIEAFAKVVFKEEYSAPANRTVISYFEQDYFSALLKIKFFISNIELEHVRNLFFLAFLAIIEDYSTHRKAGNGVKRKTKIAYAKSVDLPAEQIRQAILCLLFDYVSDLEKTASLPEPKFINKSCLSEDAFDEIPSIAGVVTSPPYANCFDYSKIYMRELWLGDFFKSVDDQKIFRNASVRSHVHSSWPERYELFKNDIIDGPVRELLQAQELWSQKIPDMLSGYFKDIGRLLSLLHPKFSSGARIGFVVGNSFYGGIPIATDILIAQMGEKLGYKPVCIDVYRGVIPSSQQYNLIEDKYFMRESLVVLEKI
jgi:hypothetical protein